MGVAIQVLLVVVVGVKVLTEAGRRRSSGRYPWAGNGEYAAKVNCHGGVLAGMRRAPSRRAISQDGRCKSVFK